MTIDKHQKRRIRELAERLGCSYTSARRAFLESDPHTDRPLSTLQTSAEQPTDPSFAAGFHLAAHRLLFDPLPHDRRPETDRRSLEVTLLWGDTVIDVRCFDPAQSVQVGPGERADFRVYDDALAEPCTVFAAGMLHAPPDAALSTTDGAGGLVGAQDGHCFALDERALLSFETTHLVFRWVKPVKAIESRVFDALDFYFTRVLSATFVLHLFLLAALWITPTGADQLDENLFMAPPPLTRAVTLRDVKRPHHLPSASHDPEMAVHAHGPSKPAPTSRLRSPAANRSQVLKAGLLGGINLSTLLSGPNPVTAALGALKGGQVGAVGPGGFGSRGQGPGSGGPLDIGDLGSAGIGRGPPGSMSFGDGHKTAAIIDRQPGHIEGGALSKEVIASIVHKHENEIRYCYESALNGHPDLYGKVSVAFTIAGTGAVSEAAIGESSLGNAAVEACIATKVRRWRFPEPHGGGQVFVTYPWIFKPAGSEN